MMELSQTEQHATIPVRRSKGAPAPRLSLSRRDVLAIPLFIVFSLAIHVLAKKSYPEMVIANARSLGMTVSFDADGAADILSNEVPMTRRLRSLAPLAIFPSLRNVSVKYARFQTCHPYVSSLISNR